ncbi:MAG: YqgE/AlgH family protein [Planctomycetaceae bacterium]|jgi:putative transcriptional regulator|nr:YqgE/AlgH family protein [Planctomycetaceae bacterium]
MDYSGKLLIASPSLTDPNFRQTIILLIQGNDEDGVVGLILNRISDNSIREIWKSMFSLDCAADLLLYVGGPVFRPLMALHTQEHLNGVEVIPGVYFTNIQQDLKRLVTDENDHLRFFVGTAGWSEGQLLHEIIEGIWYLAEATHELIFSKDAELWQHLIEAIGQNLLSEMLHTNNFPKDPTLN